MTPYLLALSLVTGVGGFFYGQRIGKQGAEAQAARDDRIAQVAYESGQRGAAEAIAKLKPRNVTIRQELEREIRTNTVYRDCRVPPDGVRLVNDAITGRAQPAGAGQLPAPDGAAP